MIPFFQPPSWHIGPFTIEVFGVFAAAGIYLAARLAAGRAERMGLDPKPLVDFSLWGVVLGVLFGHLVHLFLYHPEELVDPWRIFKVWEGLSSYGGLLGGIVAALVFFRRRGLRFMAYGDALALGVAPGWGVARIGCFAIHDHPGVRSDFLLAVNFPGGARHDLGLYDALWLFAIAALLWALARRGALQGRLLAVLAVLYGVGRFFFDFLRASDLPYHDARYLGLTPAQYFSVLIVGWGAFVLVRGARQAAQNQAAPAPSAATPTSR